MDAARSQRPDPRVALIELYDSGLARVYGYLLRRCGRREVAEELTSETFLAAADAVRRIPSAEPDIPWMIGVARHKLADHWRRQAREERGLRLVAADEVDDATEDPWDARLDAMRAEEALAALAPQYRLALTLRYVDDLPVRDVARLVGRPVQATEALLVRARVAFRAQYTADEGEVSGGA
jgi:RNA polymerase sigma-70 factor (ECF subfamily)